MPCINQLGRYFSHTVDEFPSPSTVPEAYYDLIRGYAFERISIVTLMQEIVGILRGRPELLKDLNGCLPPSCSYKFDSSGEPRYLVVDEGAGPQAISFGQVSVTQLTPDDGLPYWTQRLTVRETIDMSTSKVETWATWTDKASQMSYNQIRHTRVQMIQLEHQATLLPTIASCVMTPFQSLNSFMMRRRLGGGEGVGEAQEMRMVDVRGLVNELQEATQQYKVAIEECLERLRLMPSKAGMPQYVRPLRENCEVIKKYHGVVLDKIIADYEEARKIEEADDE